MAEKKYHQGRVGLRLTATETDFDVVIQKVIIVALDTRGQASGLASDPLDELELLVDTAGGQVIHREIQKRDRPEPSTYIGTGKAEEIAAFAQANDVDLVVFNAELSPAQQRNLEKIMKVDVVDRVALILDIFAQHATTQEGMLQVELAQLKYMMPRLKGKGSTLSQQGGGIGTRGPGETQLEVDRRKITRRISKLESDLKKLEKVRKVQRKKRAQKPEKRVAIVGYTNAGKSSLLNALAKSDAHTEDRLFATLAPTTRKVYVGDQHDYKPKVILFSDTVGFVQDLPHQLVEAFRSTLEEAGDADLLAHVIDATSPDIKGNIQAVEIVLKEIDANEIEQVLVFNKVDLLTQDQMDLLADLAHGQTIGGQMQTFFVSAKTGQGLDSLKNYFLVHSSLT